MSVCIIVLSSHGRFNKSESFFGNSNSTVCVRYTINPTRQVTADDLSLIHYDACWINCSADTNRYWNDVPRLIHAGRKHCPSLVWRTQDISKLKYNGSACFWMFPQHFIRQSMRKVESLAELRYTRMCPQLVTCHPSSHASLSLRHANISMLTYLFEPMNLMP